jgi:transcription initiation factor IIE alpha subunit|tara:strand:- start:340 stop:1314 length:975 start_codon:yes stop_codon:yes gene_type:complete
MDIIDSKYIGLISSRLQKFKRVKANLYNFRCPICGDSQKHKNKARGYFYQVKTNTNYKCHNCGASLSFNNFLKQIDATLHKQYILEKFKEGHAGGRNFVVEEPKFDFTKPVFKPKLDLPKASEVPMAREYLVKRRLDPTKFYFAQKFQEWTNKQKQTFDNIVRDECRIVIPLYDTNSELIGFQGRSLVPNSIKYITVMLNDSKPKIYGLEKVNEEKPIYIVEGPFDSTLVENSVAMCGSDIDIRTFGWSDYIWVFDNEPRNREINNRVSKIIDRGDKVVIWPSHINQKDINDMVLSNIDVISVLKSNTYSGLKAKVKFNNWKKI